MNRNVWSIILVIVIIGITALTACGNDAREELATVETAVNVAAGSAAPSADGNVGQAEYSAVGDG